MDSPVYQHTQYLPAVMLLPPLGGAAALLALDDTTRLPGPVLALCVAAALLLAVLALGRLQIELDSETIEWRFGWLPGPRWRLPLAQVQSVETTRTRWCEGWGIRRTREGWLYNARGLDAVRLRLRDGRSLRLGSDEATRLQQFIAVRLAPH